MAGTLWYFAIDEANQPHRLTRGEAERLHDGLVPPEVPRRGEGGYLVASVYVELENRVPVRVREIDLTPLAASDVSQGHVIPLIDVEVADNLCRAIYEVVRRRKVQRIDFDDGACRSLATEIENGLYVGWTYTDLIGAARQRMLAIKTLREGRRSYLQSL
jgi:hypothetical protein